MPNQQNRRPRPIPFALILAAACGLAADPLSKKTEIDFYRDVLSRDMHGLAGRSDGRLVAGPVLTDLKGPAPSDLLWCLEPGPGGKWVVGGGPGGRILEVTADLAAGTYSSKDLAKVGDPQVYALRALPDGSILAGTSPTGGLYLIRGGKVTARTGIPADSIFDIVLLDDGKSALAATGNPGRIYRIDIARFAAAGVSPDRITDAKVLAGRGVALFGEVSDRNLRRIARLADGRIAAGSAPKGNIYLFGPDGGSPFIAQENRDAEVTDLLADPKGATTRRSSSLAAKSTPSPPASRSPAPLSPSWAPQGARRRRTRIPGRRPSRTRPARSRRTARPRSSTRLPRPSGSPGAARSSGSPPTGFPRRWSRAPGSRSTACAAWATCS